MFYYARMTEGKNNKAIIDLSDLAGLSEPLTKLIETVGQGCGAVYEPIKITRKAKAEAKTKIILANADKEVSLIEQRMQERIYNKELNRQKNIEAITQNAAKELENNTSVSKTPVDPDWVTRFYEDCQDVSDEEMQTLWGRILADEVKKPKSFSYRTLDALKNLTKAEADLFTSLCEFKVHFTTAATIMPVIFGFDNPIITSKGLTFTSMHDLEAIGLIQIKTNGYVLKNTNHVIAIHGSQHVQFFNKQHKNFKIGNTMFSPIGRELSKIATPKQNPAMLTYLKDNSLKDGWSLTKT